MTHAVVTEQENGPGARFGSQVALRDEQNGKEVSYRLVGATEADVKQGRLSIESPVAQAIVGRSPGDLVRVRTPSGERSYTVLTVE